MAIKDCKDLHVMGKGKISISFQAQEVAQAPYFPYMRAPNQEHHTAL